MTYRLKKKKNWGRKAFYQKCLQSFEPDVVTDRNIGTGTRTALESGAFTTLIQAEETMRLPGQMQFLKIINNFCHSTL